MKPCVVFGTLFCEFGGEVDFPCDEEVDGVTECNWKVGIAGTEGEGERF